MDLATLCHAFAVFALFGLIWTIQLVHYPMFKLIEAPHWPRFHRFHSRNITFIVFPLMLVELVSALLLYFQDSSFSYLLALICAVTVWLMTIFIFVPLHNQVAVRPVPSKLAKLANLNWLRTLVWSFAAVNVLSNLLAAPEF